jgi:pyruvate/2-oxoglutarate dehydrogenase complex dihydrolipoamide acyltransferase (E2) component|tara:strand:+ start:59 stop:697 length:639 start_codon:yes stop_codon:yes gene_type:complete
MECVVKEGSDCKLSLGSSIRIYDEKPAEKETKTVSQETKVEDAAPAPEPAPAPAPAPEPAPAPVETVAAPAVPDLVESVGVSQDITAAADAAKSLGGDYAPMVAIALAGMAIAGGSKAWSYYRDRAEQKHEQEMQKLKMEAQSQGMDGQQPPPCQAANTKMQAEVDALKSKLSAVEKKTSMISADFDGEDVERQIKRMKKRIDELFEITDQK